MNLDLRGRQFEYEEIPDVGYGFYELVAGKRVLVADPNLYSILKAKYTAFLDGQFGEGFCARYAAQQKAEYEKHQAEAAAEIKRTRL